MRWIENAYSIKRVRANRQTFNKCICNTQHRSHFSIVTDAICCISRHAHAHCTGTHNVATFHGKFVTATKTAANDRWMVEWMNLDGKQITIKSSESNSMIMFYKTHPDEKRQNYRHDKWTDWVEIVQSKFQFWAFSFYWFYTISYKCCFQTLFSYFPKWIIINFSCFICSLAMMLRLVWWVLDQQ